jgi:hypothetical protein
MINEKGDFPFGNWPTAQPPLNFSYDQAADIITIEGIKYSGDFFRMFASQAIVDQIVRVVSNSNGVIVVEDPCEALRRIQFEKSRGPQ